PRSPLLALAPIRGLLLFGLVVLRVREHPRTLRRCAGRACWACLTWSGRWTGGLRAVGWGLAVGGCSIFQRRWVRRYVASIAWIPRVIRVVGVVIGHAAPPVRRVIKRQHGQEPGES